MASVAFQLIEEVTAHVQRDSLEDARGICADSTYFPNNLHTFPVAGCIVPMKNKLQIILFHCPFFQDSKHSSPNTAKGVVHALVKRLAIWQQK